MNESELENELRALRPARPSEALERHIARELERAPMTSPWAALPVDRPRTSLLRWLGWSFERLAWSGAGALALWVLLPAVRGGHDDVTGEPSVVAEAEAGPVTEQPVAVRDEGVTFLEGGVPARLVRYLTVEHRPLAQGAEMRLPREDVIVLPVKMQ